jgi:hypothetical protein
MILLDIPPKTDSITFRNWAQEGSGAKVISGLLGEFADIDHLIPAQTDHRFRGKLTT